MKRNFFILSAFISGLLFGIFSSRPAQTHAQEQPYKYVTPDEQQAIKNWAASKNEALSLERRRVKLAGEAQDLLEKDLKSLDGIAEKDRQPLMEKISLETRVLEAVKKTQVQSESDPVHVTQVAYGPHLITGQIEGFSCASGNGAPSCYVLSR